MQGGEVQVADVIDSALSVLDRCNTQLNAVVASSAASIRNEAERLQSLSEEQRRQLPLFGLPVTIKDNICTKDLPTTCGSKILAGFNAGYDATAVQRLRSAGALIIGKTNCDEFAMGSSTETSCYGPTRNPWDLSRVAGGTSGGSAAAVAAGIGAISLGSDTGGSVRQPASFCGVIGFKPTYGKISRFGLVSHGSSLDQIGILSRSVCDARLIFDVIAGSDELDMTSYKIGSESQFNPDKMRVASLDVDDAGCDPDVAKAYNDSIEFFRDFSTELAAISLKFLEIAVPLYYVISTAEAASNLSRYDGIRYGISSDSGEDRDSVAWVRTTAFGVEVKRRILLGTFVLSEGYLDQYYNRACQLRRWLIEEFKKLFQQYDVIMLPTSPTTAFEIGAKTKDPIQMYLSDIFTTLANLVGIPAVSIPAGYDQYGLPIGIQLMSSWHSDAGLLAVAENFERHNPWYDRRKPKIY
jgi:aspartyl-tRNA(Asn)/glutamyl-tRNA(Gln) amidotransferase subunit A